MPEEAVSELFSRHKAQIQLSQTASPCEHRTEYSAEHSLKNLERQLDYRIFGCAVNKRSAERIAYDHDHRATATPIIEPRCGLFFINLCTKSEIMTACRPCVTSETNIGVG